MARLPAELEAQILAMPGVRAGRTVAELLQPIELPPVFETEKEFQAAVVQEAKKLGWRVYHTHDSRKSAAGFPDLCMVRERVVFAELKTEDGRLTADQANWFEDLAAACAEVHAWRPSHWPDILRVLSPPPALPADPRQRFILALADRVTDQAEALRRSAERQKSPLPELG